jgi:hypothetical protein
MKRILTVFIISTICFCLQYITYAQGNFSNRAINSDTTWKYLGRPRPGMTPLRFPPDSLLATSTYMWHGTPVFSPDLKEIFWSRYNRILDRGQLVFIKYVNNSWTSVQFAPFGNQNAFESCPVYSLSGDTIYFNSTKQGEFFFRTCRTSTGWTTPEPLNIPIPQGYASCFEFSMARNGTIYFSLIDTVLHTDVDIYKSKLINGVYQIPISLGPIVNSDSNDMSPYIDPDERFIIFASKRQGGFGINDLYISKRRPDSLWANPINLGPTVNQSFEDVFPSITPDGLYFFYNTARGGDIGYNPYWISTQYIYNLISIGIENQTENIKDFELYQNYPNPFNPVTVIRYSLLVNSNVRMKVYNISGKEIATLVNEKLKAGTYEIPFSINRFTGNQISSGVYFYRLETDNFSDTKKMLLIK